MAAAPASSPAHRADDGRGRTITFASGHAAFYEEWQAFNHALATFLEESFLPPPAATRAEQP